MTIVAFVVGFLLGLGGGWYLGRSGENWDEKAKRLHADDLFKACDLQLNELKAKYAHALIQLEDARRMIQDRGGL